MKKPWTEEQEKLVIIGMLQNKPQVQMIDELGMSKWVMQSCVKYLRERGLISKRSKNDGACKVIVDCLLKHNMDRQAVIDEMQVSDADINHALASRGVKAAAAKQNTVQRKCLYCKNFFRTPPKDLIFYCSDVCRKYNKQNDGGGGDSVSNGKWKVLTR